MTVDEYRQLISDFLRDQISAEEFEQTYLDQLLSEPGGMDHVVYEILQKLFEAVDAYWKDASPDEETAFIISEESLRKDARNALDRLNEVLV